MVVARLPLSQLAPTERGILSYILFECIVGISPEHTRRWRRVWRRFMEEGVLHFFPVVARSRPFHARHMAIEDRIFEHQDGFPSVKGFRWWLKAGASFGHFEAIAGQLVFVPSSLSYEECSDDELREFHDDAVAFLRTPHALATLWPAMAPDESAKTLELLLVKPEVDDA